MASLVLWGGLPGVYGLPRCLSAVWCTEHGCDGDRERVEGARTHACEGGPIEKFRMFGVIIRVCSGLYASTACAGRVYASHPLWWCKKSDLYSLSLTLRTLWARKRAKIDLIDMTYV